MLVDPPEQGICIEISRYIRSSPSSADKGAASRALNLLALLVWESVCKLCLPSTVPCVWLDPPGTAWIDVATPVAVYCLLATLAAVDVVHVDRSVCVQASAQLAGLSVIPASERARVAPVGPCKSLIIFSTAMTLLMPCSNFAKQGALQTKSGFPSLENTK